MVISVADKLFEYLYFKLAARRMEVEAIWDAQLSTLGEHNS